MLCRFPRSHTLWTFKVRKCWVKSWHSPTFAQVNHSEWWHGGAPTWGRETRGFGGGLRCQDGIRLFQILSNWKIGRLFNLGNMTVSYDLWISWLRSLRVLWTCIYNSWYTYVPLATYSCLHAHTHTHIHTCIQVHVSHEAFTMRVWGSSIFLIAPFQRAQAKNPLNLPTSMKPRKEQSHVPRIKRMHACMIDWTTKWLNKWLIGWLTDWLKGRKKETLLHNYPEIQPLSRLQDLSALKSFPLVDEWLMKVRLREAVSAALVASLYKWMKSANRAGGWTNAQTPFWSKAEPCPLGAR